MEGDVTVEKLIRELKKLDKDTEVFFDCPECNSANTVYKVGYSVIIQTQKTAEKP